MQFNWMDDVALLTELFGDGDDNDGDSDNDDGDTESIVAPSEVSIFSNGEEEETESVVQGQSPCLMSASNADCLDVQSHTPCLVSATSNDNFQISSLVSASNADCNTDCLDVHSHSPCLVSATSLLEDPNPCLLSASNADCLDVQSHSPCLVSATSDNCLQNPSLVPASNADQDVLTCDGTLQRSLCSTMQSSHDTARRGTDPVGFTIVGDNIDKNFRPSYQRQDRQTKSLHYFHSYAAKNRVDVSLLSDAKRSAVLSVESFLPTQADLDKLIGDLETLTSR